MKSLKSLNKPKCLLISQRLIKEALNIQNIELEREIRELKQQVIMQGLEIERLKRELIKTPTTENIGKRLKELREQEGLTVTEMAEVIGVSRTSVGNWERGSKQPRKNHLKKYADYFEVSQKDVGIG